LRVFALLPDLGPPEAGFSRLLPDDVIGIMHGDWDVVPDRTVGTVFVVVSTPTFQLFLPVCKAHVPMCVQALRPKLAVEGLDEAIVRRLTWP
jgi:hypothetical protein